MFLERPGKALSKPFCYLTFTEAPLKENVIGGAKPKHLQPLGRSMWPEDIKKKIVALYEPEGVDALAQKLVEPSAHIFGGIDRGGEHDFSKVNWELVIDYFTWELESIKGTDRAEELQKQAQKKYGGIFSHYEVYDDPTPVYEGD